MWASENNMRIYFACTSMKMACDTDSKTRRAYTILAYSYLGGYCRHGRFSSFPFLWNACKRRVKNRSASVVLRSNRGGTGWFFLSHHEPTIILRRVFRNNLSSLLKNVSHSSLVYNINMYFFDHISYTEPK